MNPADDDLQTLVVPMYGASNRDQRIDDMTLVRDERDHLNTRPAPRIPRQTEPAPLWWALAVGTALLGGAAVMLGCGAHAAVASVELLVDWLRGALP